MKQQTSAEDLIWRALYWSIYHIYIYILYRRSDGSILRFRPLQSFNESEWCTSPTVSAAVKTM